MALKQMNSDKSLVIAVDVANLAVDWAHEQSGMLGISGALLHKNYCVTCANLFIGGNTESDGNWNPSIIRLTEDG